ncbi:MAG: glutamate 5-kinase [Candidatus Omnitrophica bacterium]|nr:glutamate 5-kinase [Candidatus Omnitrophota bacterium]
MKQLQKKYKRIVVKIGSSLLYSQKDKLDSVLASNLCSQIAELVKDDREVVVVSSGAIALGMSLLKLQDRPKELSVLQAAAAMGQPELMDVYRRFFKNTGFDCGQLLLTWEDFDERIRYLNAKNTLVTLLKLKSIPIINENDTVSTDEIKFGDNDRLSALVATLIGADLLIILSDVDGLLDKDKKTVVRLVSEITPQIKALACPTNKKTCVGGMITKIEAARIATDSGISCVIANGHTKDILLLSAKNPGQEGTLFLSSSDNLDAKKRWIAFSARPKGKILVDAGAKSALMNKKSLLCVGIVSIEGSFQSGDVVSIRDKEHHEFARGRVNLSSKELDKIKGTRHDKEIVHRDNLVIL